jgi:hypothetical protein
MDGVSKLLQAEQEAQEVVNKARKGARRQGGAAGRAGGKARAKGTFPKESHAFRAAAARACAGFACGAGRAGGRSGTLAALPARGACVARGARRASARQPPALGFARPCACARAHACLLCRPRARPAAKTARLRQAQEEAAAELATYRAQRDEQYKRLVASVRARCARCAWTLCVRALTPLSVCLSRRPRSKRATRAPR